MIDIKDIVQLSCDECGEPIGYGATPKHPYTSFKPAYTIMDRGGAFCSYSCAEQFVNNHNGDEAERKGESND